MRAATVFVLLLVIVVVAVDISDAARGARSPSSRSSKSRRRSRSSSGSTSSKPKITKNTKIKPIKKSSPVIKLQAQSGSRSGIFKRVLVGYTVYRYPLGGAPVYRHGYPMYGSYVSIPPERAVRLSYREQKLLKSDGKLCLGESKEKRTLRENIDEHLEELTTTVTYKKTGKTLTFHGINNTVSLEDIREEDFELTSLARYNTTVVKGTSCTQVEEKIEGTMVQMYETNPDGASTLAVSTSLLLSSIAIFAFLQVFKPV